MALLVMLLVLAVTLLPVAGGLTLAGALLLAGTLALMQAGAIGIGWLLAFGQPVGRGLGARVVRALAALLRYPLEVLNYGGGYALWAFTAHPHPLTAGFAPRTLHALAGWGARLYAWWGVGPHTGVQGLVCALWAYQLTFLGCLAALAGLLLGLRWSAGWLQPGPRGDPKEGGKAS